MTTTRLIILTILSLFSCSQPKTDFELAVDKFDQIKLPITFNSGQDFDLKGITRDSIGLGGITYGRLFQFDNISATMYLSIPVYQIIPHITTQDKDGKIIDSFNLFKTTGQEPGWSSVEDYTIYPDQTIVFVDSTETWEFKADSLALHEIEGTRRLTVTKEKYKITEDGKIKKIE